jgi:hypothetical protein
MNISTTSFLPFTVINLCQLSMLEYGSRPSHFYEFSSKSGWALLTNY